jgi:hypothetical protein
MWDDDYEKVGGIGRECRGEGNVGEEVIRERGGEGSRVREKGGK